MNTDTERYRQAGRDWIDLAQGRDRRIALTNTTTDIWSVYTTVSLSGRAQRLLGMPCATEPGPLVCQASQGVTALTELTCHRAHPAVRVVTLFRAQHCRDCGQTRQLQSAFWPYVELHSVHDELGRQPLSVSMWETPQLTLVHLQQKQRVTHNRASVHTICIRSRDFGFPQRSLRTLQLSAICPVLHKTSSEVSGELSASIFRTEQSNPQGPSGSTCTCSYCNVCSYNRLSE